MIDTLPPRERPIPAPIQPDTPAIRNLPIADNGEALVPASLLPERILARPRYHLEGLPGALAECFVRETVWSRLLCAAEALPTGYRLVLFDTWRPVSLQHWLFERCLRAFEAAGDTQAARTIEGYVSRPMRDVQANPPYHLTGGAVDLSIVDHQGRLLDMGSAFDAMTDISHTARFESDALPADGFDHERLERVRGNRRLLYHAMIDAGFVNLPSEWWHYDYGDQLWAWMHGAPCALYGATEPVFRWGELP